MKKEYTKRCRRCSGKGYEDTDFCWCTDPDTTFNSPPDWEPYEKHKKYTETGPCAHCPGTVKPNSAGETGGIIYWCDTCGGNNPERPPNVELTFS